MFLCPMFPSVLHLIAIPIVSSAMFKYLLSEDEVWTRWGLWSMMKLVTQIMTWFTYVPCSTCEQCGKHQVHLFLVVK
ncbi:hypothetical protein Hanom_Chr03g00274401 [Helianthus anomalus]